MRDRITTTLEVLGAVVIVVALTPWPTVAGVTGGLFLIALGYLEGRK